MVLSAEDIHMKKFTTKMRGYNIDEVNDFLDQVVKDYQILKDENEQLKTSLDKNVKELSYYNDLKNSLNSSILVAQEAADNVKKQSTRDAEEIIATAKDKANHVMETAKAEAEQLISDRAEQVSNIDLATNDYVEQLKTFKQKMVGMLESQLDFAKSSDWADLLDKDNLKKPESFTSVEEMLDNYTKQSVNSESNLSLPAGKSESKYEIPTSLILPNGEVRILY
ncbi:DivIVA domain-containing protein [Fructilactobacillus vespulae]|uniref:DivIVA domain-containing protein n=1 Tax=Fructilactobacillus vespulae TaxID=1249630 RepID=UPI0039B62826